jgi:DnaJ-class molecular chaperone
MRRLTDGEREVIREAEADARTTEEGLRGEAEECFACDGTGYEDGEEPRDGCDPPTCPECLGSGEWTD